MEKEEEEKMNEKETKLLTIAFGTLDAEKQKTIMETIRKTKTPPNEGAVSTWIELITRYNAIKELEKTIETIINNKGKTNNEKEDQKEGKQDNESLYDNNRNRDSNRRSRVLNVPTMVLGGIIR